jgi:hypothetical protein
VPLYYVENRDEIPARAQGLDDLAAQEAAPADDEVALGHRRRRRRERCLGHEEGGKRRLTRFVLLVPAPTRDAGRVYIHRTMA